MIKLANVGRKFANHWALKGLDLEIQTGESFAIFGPDGAGKSSLLQVMAGVLDPTEGRCEVMGCETLRLPPEIARRIGYMPQGFSLYDRLTVAENLEFAAQIRDVPGAVYRDRVSRLLATAGLTDFVGRRAGWLSGGMRKKLALCSNLIHEPELLILDEPSLGVDPLSRLEFWLMLQQFHQKGLTMVLATSYLEEADRCDQVALLSEGKLLAQGTPQQLKDLVPVEMRRQKITTLDDAFIELTHAGERQPTEEEPPVHKSKAKPLFQGPQIRVQNLTCRFGDFDGISSTADHLGHRAGERIGIDRADLCFAVERCGVYCRQNDSVRNDCLPGNDAGGMMGTRLVSLLKKDFLQFFRGRLMLGLILWLYTVEVVLSMIALAGLMVGVIHPASSIVREKEDGTIEQLAVSPMRIGELFLAKTMPTLIMGLASLVPSLAIVWWFEVPLEGSFLLFMALTGVFLLSAIGIGVMVGVLCQNMQQALLVSFFGLFPIMFLSGTLVPVESMPGFLQWVSKLSPLRYYMDVILGIFLKGIGWAELKEECAALLMMGLFFFGCAFSFFRGKTVISS